MCGPDSTDDCSFSSIQNSTNFCWSFYVLDQLMSSGFTVYLHKGKSLHRYYLHQIHHFHSSILYIFLVVVLTCKYSLDFQCCGDYSFQRQLTGLLVLMSVLPLRYSSTSCRFPSRAARRNPAFPSLCKHTTHRSLGHCYHTHTNRIPSQHTHH